MKGLEHLNLLKRRSNNQEYHIESKTSGPWWWQQTQYWVVSDHGSLGPYDKKSEAEAGLRMINRFEAKYKDTGLNDDVDPTHREP